MPTTPLLLANGQVAAAKATIYTVPAATQAIIRTVSFAQVAGGTQVVILYVKKAAGTSRVFSRAQLEANEFAHEEEIGTLDAADELEAETTNAASVDYSIHGVEVTP
jgi:hypothetical protein